MIILEIKEYCHHCPGFEADVRKEQTGDHNTVIRCRYKGRCESMVNYLKKETKEHGLVN